MVMVADVRAHGMGPTGMRDIKLGGYYHVMIG